VTAPPEGGTGAAARRHDWRRFAARDLNEKGAVPMAITVRIPTPLRTLTGGADEVAIEGVTVGEVIDNLEKKHPGIKERLCDEKGVRRFVNIYANEEDIRFLDNLGTKLKAGDSVSIVPAIAGG
jgi:molybdopterin synthase sulfur carrier subunit